ncbi:GNAT family N-acetyltransferase [Secundilactobacillus mixtipabuli]|uniref:GNAT family acetyltransferase n=1 Tax=Secundilactobacillus mixtipabuli TaxID=1435342 RepID=A0A1Z5ID67_9LACO|nr:GNAT family N-acetyltransferase [Secundilactobacillus mixtipabuli]GAW99753.1 GNAT family acetyltransferase [Secundilactobacillus mixtipabuli]
MANEAELTIRKAVSTDAHALLTLLTKLKAESTTFEDTSDEVDSATESRQIKQISDSNFQLLLVVQRGNELVGLSTVLPTDDEQVGEIGVAVLKNHWAQGIGRELMLSGLDWAALNSRYRIITLTVQKRNQRAVKLYQNIGFQVTEVSQVTDSVGQLVEAYEMQVAVK